MGTFEIGVLLLLLMLVFAVAAATHEVKKLHDCHHNFENAFSAYTRSELELKNRLIDEINRGRGF